MSKGKLMKKVPAAEKKKRPVRSLRDCSRQAVLWLKTNDPLTPFRAEVGPDAWSLRLDDFPAEHLYTLIVNGCEVGAFDDWPKNWKQRIPAAPKAHKTGPLPSTAGSPRGALI
jgi:hypothetical protein